MSSTILNQSVASGTKIQQDVGGSGLKGVVIGNSSNLQATVILQGASISRTLYPYTVDFFQVPHDASGNPLPWSGNLLIDFATGIPDTGAYVQVDTIGANEPFKNTYPIALSRGMVNTTLAGNTLSYEASTPGTKVIDIGTAANNNDWQVFNDGSATLKVEQGGVQHIVITLRSSGKPLLLGQANDHVEIADTLDIDNKLFVVGITQLDSGLIASDSNGNLTVVSVSNAQGIIRGTFFIAPYHILSAATINVNTQTTLTCTGVGGIPAGAKGVWIAFAFQTSTAGGSATFTPHGTGWANANYPSSPATANNNQFCSGAFLVPLDGSGKMDMGALTSNLTGIDAQLFGYII